ncbi:MAG TPA: Lrp/AsnC family transcriptional regulator [Candidatus Saccharimonadales bacterium]|nr:Lrp/AsnC family transcriptional regulator [Candidatus Saccharimonadales bacterium]
MNKTNKEISIDISIPLSTIQRRVRNLILAGYVTTNVQTNYQKFGFKTILVHVFQRNGNIDDSEEIHSLKHITTVEIHIGNSDILGPVTYKEGEELLNLISTIKEIGGVERIAWSERIYQSIKRK